MNKDSKVLVAGASGMVGSAMVEKLRNSGYNDILTPSHDELDLTNQNEVKSYFKGNQPDYVFLFAAKVGGIMANKNYKADFIRDNLLIQTNVIDSAYHSGAEKLLFLGSSCIYPKYPDSMPIQEDSLLAGHLEPTNDAYALAKIAGIKMCQSYQEQYGFNAISLMPCNLYGKNDSFDLENSHVLPALIRKFHEAKEEDKDSVEIWGTGSPKREFLYVDDLVDACLFLMENYDSKEIVNVGTGKDISIGYLAHTIAEIVGFEGSLRFDTSKPDGTPRKVLDVSKLNELGWKASTSLEEGIAKTYKWYCSEGVGKIAS